MQPGFGLLHHCDCMKTSTLDLPGLLAQLNPEADLAQRHLWLIHLFEWIRAPKPSTEQAVERVRQVVATFEADPVALERLRQWWQKLITTVDITALLADFGFAPRTAMMSELAERMRYKLLPSTPETVDASELFMLALHDEFDARWLRLNRYCSSRWWAPSSSTSARAPQPHC